ncbi:FixH family protein [Pleionea sp. CnH1-48]|uniref:FixH family protein n=1 Tax=Pleionea sp. CnH1-48 TaxID=2954494 RepID=UPI002097621A|nr:FixH family protein [Pleionea sp. CnH1-48]MCO7223345.1 FixH family protein [Pleionea sp. CnH1-48]
MTKIKQKLFFTGLIIVINLSLTIKASDSAETFYGLDANELFDKANHYFELSDTNMQKSRALILEANSLRKKINKLRAHKRRESSPLVQDQLAHDAQKLALQLEQKQLEGGRLRAESLSLKQRARSFFEEAFCQKWKPWVKNRDPLTMDDTIAMTLAHNSRILSVKPSLLNRMATGTDRIKDRGENDDMSLQIPALASQNAPPDLDISAFQISREQDFFGHIEVDAHPEAKAQHNVSAVPLNKIHRWHLLLSDRNGQPVTNANVDIEGHMPGHVHGLPTEPRVTKEVAPGVYQVEGLKFQMKGWWVISFKVHSADKESVPDDLTFNLVL